MSSVLSFVADPFHWAWLPLANEPFSENICLLVLEKLKSQQFVHSLVDDLRTKFSVSFREGEGREEEVIRLTRNQNYTTWSLSCATESLLNSSILF